MCVIPPTGLVPVRVTPGAKRRLAHVLSARERMRLVRALFDHVTAVLADAGLDVIALSPTPIEAPGVEVWTDAAPGLNRALEVALGRLGEPVLVVHADLPLLSTADVDRVLGHRADVVVARALDGGTNGLLMREPIRPAFGPGSAHAHARRARGAGLRTAVVDVPGFALDVDDDAALSAVPLYMRS